MDVDGDAVDRWQSDWGGAVASKDRQGPTTIWSVAVELIHEGNEPWDTTTFHV